MDIANSLYQFHFLRPAWLLLLVPAGFLMWSVYQRSDSLRAWKQVITPHLLEHLLLEENRAEGRWRPVYVLGFVWLVAVQQFT